VLAQGLSLRGHRVLVIDTDPQGSLTTLHGILPETEVSEDMTIASLCDGSETDITYAIRSTYWDGIDLVSAAPSLYQAEFALPARQMQSRDFEFWNVLRNGLAAVRSIYDVIIIDTPPSLSYLTINALWAANGIVVPVPPSGLERPGRRRPVSWAGMDGGRVARISLDHGPMRGVLGDLRQAVRLVARRGTRFVLLLGTTLVGLAVLWTVNARHPVAFLLSFGVLLSVGLGFTSPVALTPVISHWFTRRRGMALFFLSTGSMAGMAVMTPALAFAIGHFGWQATTPVAGNDSAWKSSAVVVNSAPPTTAPRGRVKPFVSLSCTTSGATGVSVAGSSSAKCMS